MTPLEELYRRYDEAAAVRQDVAKLRAELETAERICREEIAAAQEAIRQWYTNNTNSVEDELLVRVLVADKEKNF